MKSKRILVVEDDVTTQVFVRRVLVKAGHVVSVATNGNDALSRLKHGPRPHLILLDLIMEGMDGWQVMKRLSQDPVLAGIPLVVLSGAIKEASPSPSAEFLPKPVDAKHLLAV